MPGSLDAHEGHAIDHARVDLRNGTSVVLDGVVVRSDSVTGYDSDARARVAFARAQVVRVSDRGFDTGRTVVLVAGTLAVAAVAVVAAILVALKVGGSGTLAPSPAPVGL
jgi:hypothetical protein